MYEMDQPARSKNIIYYQDQVGGANGLSTESLGLRTFEFIKAVSNTVLDTTNVVYHDKTLIFIRTTFREELISYHWAVNEGCF